MEHLTKQQIVLLTLLVSFVTSLSTGIITVSLMDQAPASITRTVNQIIEKTVTAPQSASVGTISLSVDDQIAKATASVASSTVQIRNAYTHNLVSLGLIVSKNGLIITEKINIDSSQSYEAVLSSGVIVPLTPNMLYQTQVNADMTSKVAYFTPSSNMINGSLIVFTSITPSTRASLGQKIFSFGLDTNYFLVDGLISQVSTSTIVTTISNSKNSPGSPLFDIEGNVIGIQAPVLDGQTGLVFYPIAPLMLGSNVL